MLEMAADVRSAMVDHAIAAVPQEACGLFAGPPGRDLVDRFFATRNASASATSFRLDGREMLDVERWADDLGLEIKGVMHSHPTTRAYPSRTDIAHAARFDPLGVWWSVIVSLEYEEPVVRGFRITDGLVEEDEILTRDGR